MKLAIIVPCYNEEAVLPETTKRLCGILDDMTAAGSIDEGIILYVDDGSRDSTWSLIEQFSGADNKVAGLKLSHNRGHQHALWAGLEWAAEHADAAVSIDADLQDDETVIPKMVNVLGGHVVYNHADYRLMSRRTLQALVSFPERNLFLRGMVASLGFPSAFVYYDRKARFAGTSKYPLAKMFSFAVDGITSFSTRPLRFITYLGLVFILIALGVIIYALVEYFNGTTIQGWTSLLVSVWFIGGVVLLACGIIGEYVGKIYIESKGRPRYFIEKETGTDRATDARS